MFTINEKWEPCENPEQMPGPVLYGGPPTHFQEPQQFRSYPLPVRKYSLDRP